MSEQEQKKSGIVKWVGLILIIIIIVVIIWLLRPKESYTPGEDRVTRVGSLECSGVNVADPFFISETAQNSTHEIKSTFKNNRLEDALYTFISTYNSADAVEAANASLHAEYNTYMGKNFTNPEILTPVFSNIKSKLQITLYADKGEIDPVTARLFFLSAEDYAVISQSTPNQIKNIYESKGFTCTYYE